jgi:hypothetical protein
VRISASADKPEINQLAVNLESVPPNPVEDDSLVSRFRRGLTDDRFGDFRTLCVLGIDVIWMFAQQHGKIFFDVILHAGMRAPAISQPQKI